MKPLIVRFVKFYLVGSAGAGLQLLITYLLTEKAHVHYLASQGLAILCALVLTFSINNIWTFRERKAK